MKKIFFLFLFLGVTILGQAQLRKIPADVTDAFIARYPHATRVEWRDRLQYFQATFELNGSSISANFSSKGEWEESERELDFDQLPVDVKDGFENSRYATWQKNSAHELQQLGKPLQYRFNVQKSGLQKKNLYFDCNGKLLKETITL